MSWAGKVGHLIMDELGQSLFEYAFLLSLVSIIVIFILKLSGLSTLEIYNFIFEKISTISI